VWRLKLAAAAIEAVIICLWLRGDLRGLDLGVHRPARMAGVGEVERSGRG